MESMEGFCETCNIKTPNIQGNFCCFCGCRLFTRPAGPQHLISQSKITPPADAQASFAARCASRHNPSATNVSEGAPAIFEQNVSASSTENVSQHAESESESETEDNIMKLFHPVIDPLQSSRPNVEQKRDYGVRKEQRPRRKTFATLKRKPSSTADSIVTTTDHESNNSNTIEVVHKGVPRRSTRVARSLSSCPPNDNSRTKRRRRDDDHGIAVFIPRNEFGDLGKNDSITRLRLRFMKNSISDLEDAAFSAPFRTPVDCLSLPTYLEEIEKPMDLAEIARKLETQRYSTVSAFIDDFELIISNCITFNGTESWVTDYAKKMESQFVNNMRGLPWSYEDSLP
ncbi:transcription initiation at TATA-containing promoter protein [Rhinocladiella similis]